ncbi:hypothetical protein BaRGS_00013257 [Batillaria attramentaria]|uniref:VWFA domain-containing protein n=1 Tax=Batillaria attramentaria TaxID=370345 RepID=A0ABD0L835_9CAEN
MPRSSVNDVSTHIDLNKLKKYGSSQTGVSVRKRSSSDMANMIAVVRDNMATVLQKKEKAVMKLKSAAEAAMKQYGPYKEFIDFEEVNYFNAKKVVIDRDLKDVEEEYWPKIKGTIDYLPTTDLWDFNRNNLQLNPNTSTVHVPTNIYDKSMKILNGVQWTENLTQQFIKNSKVDPTLTWQYFCSSDGFFRVYPGMQWPRDPEKVDIFDCRMRKWYIQAASTPKNIIILLDTSGSMTGKRFTIAQSTVSTILDTLSDQDYFNIIKYSTAPEYVDPCFNGTLIPANVDNIRRMQDKILDISTKDQANLRDALTVAFQLFAEEEKLGSICNKAIMIITDGAPENYVDVFNSTNWPEKATRIFTYLIGKEVADDRKVKWMACVNKGEFTHISTKADVQENVQQYIKMLSRPLAQNKSNHHVWGAVYLDYPTDKSDIQSQPFSLLKDRIDAAYEPGTEFKGLGLVISFARPVFDTRTAVGKTEEEPSKNLLGVVGTDVRINDLVKLIPAYKLGVNGYAFAVTNHGYVLFHPGFRPFYSTDPHDKTLKLRPKYNSVDLSEVELPYGHTASKGHPLRQYLLTAQEGSNNKTVTMLTHFDNMVSSVYNVDNMVSSVYNVDNMRRVRLQKNHYQFTAVDNTFRLVFVLPENYGDKYLKIEKRAASFSDDEFFRAMLSPDSKLHFAPWIYCTDKNGMHVAMSFDVFNASFYSSTEYECDQDQVRHLLFDAVHTEHYASQWNGSRYNPSGRTSQPDNPVRSQCLLPNNNWTQAVRAKCVQQLYTKRYTASIKSLYYQRAVYGWQEGLKYVFFLDLSKESTSWQVIMAAAEVVGKQPKLEMPVAVSAFRMSHDVFAEIFNNNTGFCPSKHHCPFTCANSDMMNCYLIDNNGYIMAVNNNETQVRDCFAACSLIYVRNWIVWVTGYHRPVHVTELGKIRRLIYMYMRNWVVWVTELAENREDGCWVVWVTVG